jgi:hypothetical protein
MLSPFIIEKIKSPVFTAVFFFMICLVTFFLNFPYEKEVKLIWSDSEGYYQYLPAIFSGGDLKHLYYAIPLENGNTLNIFHIGVAIMEAPFYLVADLFAWMFGYERDGRSDIYMYFLGIGAAFYLSAAMYFLHRFLSAFFEWKIVTMSMLLIFFGTNLYYYSTIEVGMSHVYSFFLFSLFIFLVKGFHDEQKITTAIWIGLVAGLILVIRPNNGIITLFLIFYGVTSVKSLGQKMVWWIRNIRFVAIMMSAVLFIAFFQMLYWHHVSDKWILFSYGQIGQQFFWTKALMGKVLFSPQNGFLIYSPIMFFALIGLIWGGIKGNKGYFLNLLIWVLAWYVFASWWCWWFGGAYGHRAFIEYFVLLFPGFAWVITKIDKKIWAKYGFYAVAALFVFVNLRMTFIYASPWDGKDWGWDDYGLIIEKVFFLLPQ